MSKELLANLSDAFGVSGYEKEVAEVAKNYLKSDALFHMDKIGNLYIKSKHTSDKKEKRPLKVLFDAHQDEVGFVIQAIRPNGMLDFLKVGGWVVSNVPAHTVIIKTHTGRKIKGVIASTPPHFMTETERKQALSFDKLVIDVGTSSKEETESLGIEIGDPVVPDVRFEMLNDNLCLGKAFDCRIGCACLLETFKDFYSNEKRNREIEIEAILTTQEEIGERGSTVAAQNTDADIAIIFEGCPADDTFTEAYKIQTALGKGPMLRHHDVSMITHPGFQRLAIDTATEFDLPIQRSVRSGGGTNGASYSLSKKAIPCIVIGIPVRYAHTHYCYSDYRDLLVAKELSLRILEKLNQEVFDKL
ncbi:M42 family peptidase [Atopobacter sp. AH10]|uniref:M42 family metallopeptidase n=1 Tax=Atopobacter sp. AH10 TaxID=2315861 RepID=UPI000EF18672|nr:M20/M25/M40 family metallo-hydrolase [Atopobacter sp. AH10]RLK63726.1 M42 family peptidase [Atopobacter sp. AH10]